jgi:DNA-binding winged helix-turn-helix (wHTH) protein
VTVRFGAFTLNSDQRQLTREGEDVHLTPKAFDLLGLLVAEAPRVVRKSELHERLWPGTFVSDATLVSLVKELRHALNDRAARAPIIRTAHGIGYAFAAPLERTAPRVSTVARWIVSGGRRVVLSERENVIGRDPTSAIWLDVAGVSRRHARIVVAEERVWLEDLGSKNGTSIGGESVTGKVTLHDSDRIQIGPVLIIYHMSAGGLPTETVARPSSDRRKRV